MSVVELRNVAAKSHETSRELISDLAEPPHGKHEDNAHPDADLTLDAITNKQSEPGDHDTDSVPVNGKVPLFDTPFDENLAPKELVDTPPASGEVRSSKDAASKKRGPMSLTTNTPPVKSNGDPSTPLVKKIINSGTFGTGTVKPTGLKASVSGSATVTKPASGVAPALKKAASSAPAPTSRQTVTSRTPAAATTLSRRASVVPSKPSVPVASKPPLSSSVNSKPTPDNAKVRTSVASPTGSVSSAKGANAARPRASVSEGVKRTPLGSKPSVTPTTKTSGTSKSNTASRAPASSAPKSTVAAASNSITSIQELKEDNNVLEGLQRQLNEVEGSLRAKADAVEKLEAALQNTLNDVEAKSTLTEELERAKLLAESQLQEAQQSLANLQNERESSVLHLRKVQEELEAANTLCNGQAEQVEKLQAQIAETEAKLASAKILLDSFQANHSTSLSEAEKSIAEERQSLLKAQAAYKTLAEEVGTLKVAQTEAAQAATTKHAELELKVAELSNYTSRISKLQLEKEETASKVSELEIEVLELNERVEELEDVRDRLKAAVTSLESELEKSATDLEQTVKAANLKETDYESLIEVLKTQHEKDLAAASGRRDTVVGLLESLKTELSAALATRDQYEKDIVTAQESHDAQLQKLKELHTVQQAKLHSEIAEITETLQGQEGQYESKVKIVKVEHENLLKEAFDRAKTEAAAAHSQELQALRAESRATMEQIQASNKHSLDSLKDDHASTLEATIKDYTKQLNNLTIELRATQDDLAKSKANAEKLRADLDFVQQERDEARAAANSPPAVSSNHITEISHLTQELSNTKDDLAAITDMLNLTKSSMTELSDKHSKDLELAAQGRADEVTRLNAVHESEITYLAAQRSGLLVKLSDLEGELATLKAAIAAEAASPKSNGAGLPLPSSPNVTKEELAKMHEAHNLKIYDLQAEHEKAVKALTGELEVALGKSDDLQQEVARKAMEIQYLEQEQDENQEQITRLKEDIETLTERCAKEHTAAV